MSHHRIVVKIGSNILLSQSSENSGLFDELFKELAHLQRAGWAPLLVLSGAVATGKALVQLKTKQAEAAVGQLALLTTFQSSSKRRNVATALLLLSREDILNRDRYETLRDTLDDLIDHEVVPILNENDATSLTETPDFRDNDHLATIIAMMVEAKRLVLLTDVDGVFSQDPRLHNNSTVIPEIENINLEIIKRLAHGKSLVGRGGMAGKLTAARMATAAGITTHIMNGTALNRLTDVVVEKAHVGTVCSARSRAAVDFSRRDRWLLSAQNTGASIRVDAGAVMALKKRKSLLAVGVQEIIGNFGEKECVELIDDHRETIALGLTTLSSPALQKLLRQKQRPYNIEVVHADNLRLLV